MIDDQPAHGRYALRGLTDDDEHWMWPAGCEAMRPWVEPLFGWDDQDARYFFDKSWRNRRVVLVAGVNAGWLELAIEKDWLLLHDIGLLPAYRGRGLGAQIIADVNAYADAHGVNVELQVLVTNPAQRLYERMGFRPTHAKMHRPAGGWKAEPPTGPAD